MAKKVTWSNASIWVPGGFAVLDTHMKYEEKNCWVYEMNTLPLLYGELVSRIIF